MNIWTIRKRVFPIKPHNTIKHNKVAVWLVSILGNFKVTPKTKLLYSLCQSYVCGSDDKFWSDWVLLKKNILTAWKLSYLLYFPLGNNWRSVMGIGFHLHMSSLITSLKWMKRYLLWNSDKKWAKALPKGVHVRLVRVGHAGDEHGRDNGHGT